MAPKNRASVDVTVVRDLLDQRRRGHQSAKKLFDLQDVGAVDLTIAPQGHRDDVPEGPLEKQVRVLVASGRLAESSQLAYISEVTITPFVIGAGVPGFTEAWDTVIQDWKSSDGKPPGDKDRWHAETHVHEGADVFVTSDRALRNMCRRLREEHDIPIVAMDMEAYLESLE